MTATTEFKRRDQTWADPLGGSGMPCCDDGSIGADLVAWNKFSALLNKHINRGAAFANPIVSTYSLVYTASSAYNGGVLDSNGNIHFVPGKATVGQKVSPSGDVSTYSLVYTTVTAYQGGVLDSKGNIHFVPYKATVGQKVSAAGVVSTYPLVFTNAAGAAQGGTLDPNGYIHFAPFGNMYGTIVGQKVSPSGVVSTYGLVYTGSANSAVSGGACLAPNGDVHFVKQDGAVGQKVSPSGVVSTYSLIFTGFAAMGGVLAPNGDIHFISNVGGCPGQKININGVVSTYAMIADLATGHNPWWGGVLGSDGCIYFVPGNEMTFGLKLDTATNVQTTFSLPITGKSFTGGVLMPNGEIHFIPFSSPVGMKITNAFASPLPLSVCCSPWLNKL